MACRSKVWVVRAARVVTAATVLCIARPANAERVVYLNLDPQALNSGAGNDPAQNSHATTGFVPGSIGGWPTLSDADRALLLHWFKQATVPFDIRFVLDRPAVGTYDMLVFGSEADNTALFPSLGCSPAIGLADCTDTDAEDISFMFWGCMPAAQQDELERVAFYGLTAMGFSWGLENLVGTGQIMGSYSLTGLEFGSVCTAISGTSQCTHSGCGASQQNSTTDLNGVIGPRVDDGPPVVTITAPTNYAIVDPELTIAATVDDAFGGVAVALEVVEAGQSLDDDVPPHSWHLQAIPAGKWTLRVTATDADANVSMQEVVVCVGLDECNDEVGGSSSGGGSSSDGGGADTSTGAAETTTGEAASSSDGGGNDTGGAVTGVGTTLTTGGFGGGDAAPGCGCASDPRGGAGAWGLALLVACTRRRRSAPSRAERLAQPLVGPRRATGS